MQGQHPDNYHHILAHMSRMPQTGPLPEHMQGGQLGDRCRGGGNANQRHIKTEQKRRDRINDGFQSLQNLLPTRDKVEKAAMLGQAADYIRTLQGLMQQVVESKAMTALPSEQQFNLRMLLPRKPEQPVPYAPYSAPPAPMMAHGIPQAHPMQPPFRAHENQQPPDHSIVNQMQLLQCAQALVQPGYYGMHMGGMGQGMPPQQRSTGRSALTNHSSSPGRTPSPPPTLVAPKASMPSPTGLQQLVEAAGGMAAENKENASRKRGRELSESIPPPQKQRCYEAGAAVDFASLPDFMIHI